VNRMKYERWCRGLSGTVVAVICRMHQPTYSAIENGKLLPNRPQRERLAAFFKISPNRLLESVEVLDDQTDALVKVGRLHLRVKQLEAETAG
jgi:transcriptional regulator with XRE-family HTH domain